MPRAIRSENASRARPKKVMASTRPAKPSTATMDKPTAARAELRRKKASSLHTRMVKGSCTMRCASTLIRSACSSVMASESSRPRMRTRTLLSSVCSGAACSGVMRPAGASRTAPRPSATTQ